MHEGMKAWKRDVMEGMNGWMKGWNAWRSEMNGWMNERTKKHITILQTERNRGREARERADSTQMHLHGVLLLLLHKLHCPRLADDCDRVHPPTMYRDRCIYHCHSRLLSRNILVLDRPLPSLQTKDGNRTEQNRKEQNDSLILVCRAVLFVSESHKL